jgi:hypothetical protein
MVLSHQAYRKGLPQVSSSSFHLALLGLLLLGATGCGSGGTYPVQGKVVFQDGTPLKGGIVVFESVDHAHIIARGDIAPDGTFELGTKKPGDGALAGKHRVLVAPLLPSNVKESKGPRPIHPRFENFETSKLVLTVEKRDNDFTIHVEKP